MTLYKEYLDTIVENEKIKFTISFNKETRNWATGESKKIGYQVSAVPVKINDFSHKNVRGELVHFTSEESGAFTGFCDNLIEIDRQSKKRLESAISKLKENMETYKEWFKLKYKTEFKDGLVKQQS